MRLHVISDGTGSPPIVFIHGLGSTAATWALCMAQLRDRHHVLAIDLLGHGESPVPDDPAEYTRDRALADIDEVLARLTEPPVLAGDSLGGCLALAHAATRPGAARGCRSSHNGYNRSRETPHDRPPGSPHRYSPGLTV